MRDLLPVLPDLLPPGVFLREGVVPRALSFYGLIAFDMDSTLINIECIDEIADAVGKKAEVAQITEATMRGDIPNFRESLLARVGLLRGVPVQALQSVYDTRLRLNPGAEALVQACRDAGLKVLLVSGGFTFFAERLRARLGLDFVRSNLLEIEGDQLTGRVLPQAWGDVCDGEIKRRTLLEVASLLGIDATQTIAVGDGSNDIPMMQAAGLSVAYHAKARVREQADVAIDAGGLDRLLSLLQIP
ncbi:MAG: phosphoserine phosphatase SerB [Pseudoxanthomonas sp.]